MSTLIQESETLLEVPSDKSGEILKVLTTKNIHNGRLVVSVVIQDGKHINTLAGMTVTVPRHFKK